jgi:Flp pilus assembly protein TadD
VRVALLLLAPILLLAEEQTFEVRGQISRRVKAVAAIHSATDPFTATTLIGPDRKFKFKKIPQGAYTITIQVSRVGSVRRSIQVGRGAADEWGRVNVRISVESALLIPDRGSIVTIHELSVPRSARNQYDKAMKRLSKRDVEGAIRHLHEAVEIAPQFSVAWNHLGTIAFQTKHFAEAEQHFRRAKEGDPLAYEPVVNLGGVLVTTGKLQEALELNLEAVERRPKDALAHAQLGLTYLNLKQFENAEKHLIRAARLDPKHPLNPQLRLAELYEKQKNTRKAARQLAELLRHHPDWPDAEKVRETIRLWQR